MQESDWFLSIDTMGLNTGGVRRFRGGVGTETGVRGEERLYEHEVESTHDTGAWGKQNHMVIDHMMIGKVRMEGVSRDEQNRNEEDKEIRV